MKLVDKLRKLFYGLRYQLMAGHIRPGMNQKSVQDSGVLGHFSKSDIRYWQRAVFRQTYTRNGKTLLTKGWAMKIAHEGRRETFPLGTPNKAAAAARARDIYLSLAGAGWEATLARYKRAKALTGEGETSGPRTVGQFLDEVFRTASNQRTVESYAKKIQADCSGDLRSVGRQREA